MSDTTASDDSTPTTATVDGALRLAHGVHEKERDHVVAALGRLDSRLRSFGPDDVEMQLSVKERDTPSQRTTLEAWIARRETLVATSTAEGFDEALHEVRDELIRQITDAKNRSEPRNNRALRDTVRDEG